jgi:hypothetical protein
MSLRVLFSLSLCSLSFAAPLGLAGCGGKIPKAEPTRESGQSGMMNDSFAGQNACNPENHLRPFIIEWDATDMSSFESITSTDIVVVHYEGCEMRVLDACRNDSIRGRRARTSPIEWTTGQLEKMLTSRTRASCTRSCRSACASLGGRVAGGEKFAMEYYVAGTRNATRDAVYREDIAKNPACKSATHYVYGYNLGAFALGT